MQGLTGRSSSALVAFTSLALTGGHLVARLPLMTTRRFDPDELEHAHVAWCILQGQVPYRDFFEHHTPLFHYLLAGLLSVFDVSRSADSAFHALFAARYLGWAMSAAILIVTFVLARRLQDGITAWVTLPIAAGSIVMALRAVEIRPDGLSTVLWLCSLIPLHAALRSGQPGSPRTRHLFGAAGAALGLAGLTSQKSLLAGPALALLALWYVFSPRFGGRLRTRIGDITWQAGGALATWALAIGAFASQGAAADFLRLTIFENLRWKTETSAAGTLGFLIRYDPWFFGLAAGGGVLLLRGLRDAGERRVSDALLLACAAGTFAGLFLLPVPYPQYCLTFLPLLAIMAASLLVRVVRTLASADAWSLIRRAPGWTGVALLAFAGTSLIALVIARPSVLTPVLYPALVAAAAAVALAVPMHGRPHVALAAVLLVLSVIPAQAERWLAGVGDDGQFAALRFVLDHTSPEAVVLDGSSGYGVFRRHAIFFWMLHPGVRAMLSTDQVAQLVDGVTSGRVRPDVVVLDKNLRQVSPRLTAFIEHAYTDTGVDTIRVRPSSRLIVGLADGPPRSWIQLQGGGRGHPPRAVLWPFPSSQIHLGVREASLRSEAERRAARDCRRAPSDRTGQSLARPPANRLCLS
jgi:hypothetical protein